MGYLYCHRGQYYYFESLGQAHNRNSEILSIIKKASGKYRLSLDFIDWAKHSNYSKIQNMMQGKTGEQQAYKYLQHPLKPVCLF